jgi:hypothetical protein
MLSDCIRRPAPLRLAPAADLSAAGTHQIPAAGAGQVFPAAATQRKRASPAGCSPSSALPAAEDPHLAPADDGRWPDRRYPADADPRSPAGADH